MRAVALFGEEPVLGVPLHQPRPHLFAVERDEHREIEQRPHPPPRRRREQQVVALGDEDRAPPPARRTVLDHILDRARIARAGTSVRWPPSARSRNSAKAAPSNVCGAPLSFDRARAPRAWRAAYGSRPSAHSAASAPEVARDDLGRDGRLADARPAGDADDDAAGRAASALARVDDVARRRRRA